MNKNVFISFWCCMRRLLIKCSPLTSNIKDGRNHYKGEWYILWVIICSRSVISLLIVVEVMRFSNSKIGIAHKVSAVHQYLGVRREMTSDMSKTKFRKNVSAIVSSTNSTVPECLKECITYSSVFRAKASLLPFRNIK